LRQFGAVELPATIYLQRLDEALRMHARFYCDPPSDSLDSAIGKLLTQSMTHKS
jgi:hypothetical protein